MALKKKEEDYDESELCANYPYFSFSFFLNNYILHHVFVTFLCNTGFPFTLDFILSPLKTLVCYNSFQSSLKVCLINDGIESHLIQTKFCQRSVWSSELTFHRIQTNRVHLIRMCFSQKLYELFRAIEFRKEERSEPTNRRLLLFSSLIMVGGTGVRAAPLYPW